MPLCVYYHHSCVRSSNTGMTSDSQHEVEDQWKQSDYFQTNDLSFSFRSVLGMNETNQLIPQMVKNKASA
ncbi:hypothetical protein GUITHDRAFT_154733 [Guillardia theta CCMP2712]|uniref:Uncharacterized protein n=1 Tax=Guillardia theta (strain CCMP2712) TaxID=905079 RepID=L1IQ38_GUITC|nr:hypothetical protein GUITHDRAFT_154733 [Guillardia theta CCMP2712]EKX38358.1 hypothetical protein GUITHDRAFT_154733 [Guillardia theta CCMP2712]|eukprot:XP_005825338.1 hypothetical protein GUITHDRAFT_154733 [Guillardia theta CCMP2712]